MPTAKGAWKTVKTIDVGEKGLKLLINQAGDNPVQVNMIRERKGGKTVAARVIWTEEWAALAKAIPGVQKFLVDDDKRVVAAKAKAAKASKGNGGTKKAETKKTDKTPVKAAAGKTAGTKKSTGKKAGTKKASSKKPAATAAGKKDVSIDDIL